MVYLGDYTDCAYMCCKCISIFLKASYYSPEHPKGFTVCNPKNTIVVYSTNGPIKFKVICYFKVCHLLFVAPAKQSATYGSFFPSSVCLSVRPSVTLCFCWRHKYSGEYLSLCPQLERFAGRLLMFRSSTYLCICVSVLKSILPTGNIPLHENLTSGLCYISSCSEQETKWLYS